MYPADTRTDPEDGLAYAVEPLKHQVEGIRFMLGLEAAALLDEQGSGKTFQFIYTACGLFNIGEIDTVVVVAPAGVRTTWADPEFGEVAKYCSIPYFLEEYSGKNPRLHPPSPGKLHWVVTNYEFIRQPIRLQSLISQVKGWQVMLVCDESSFIKSPTAQQTRACFKLGYYCKRRYIGNGTPIGNSLLDLYSQFAVLDKKIIGCENWWQFRNRYAIMGGWRNKQIMGYRNVEHLQKRIKPFALRRLKEDCNDLPPKLYNVVEVPLEPETWRVYKQLKEEMVAWLDSMTPIMTAAAVVKILRLSQLTSGIAGGVDRSALIMEQLGFGAPPSSEGGFIPDPPNLRVISNEKHKWVADWFKEQASCNPGFKAIIWTRFRHEQVILAELLKEFPLLRIYGGQDKEEREDTIRKFNQPSSQAIPLLGQPRAGGFGTNLQADCAWAVYISNDYSLITRLQSEDRIHRQGQKASVVNYIDVLATGPSGQRTIDHAIKKALLKNQNIARWTSDEWRTAITEE